jgi:alkylation response protein AidB-like acyl-CoA dehydrogenase
MAENNAAKEAAMEMAEAARESEWKFPSFTAEMYRGNFRWDLLHPYPEQDAEDKRIGDELIEKVRVVMEQHDPIKLDETGEYPKETLKRLAEVGIFGMKISKEYGGLGLTQWNYARLLRFIGSYCQTTVTYVSAHQSIGVPQPLKLFGTPEQKKKFLPRLAAGAISAFALTEPPVGSDPAKMETTATPSDDGTYYLINGTKLWCTNGPDSELMVVMAQTPPIISKSGKEIKQISTFVVETNSPGVEVIHRCNFMGLHGLSNGLITFTNVKVPAENMIGKPGMGLKIALTTLNAGRLGIPAANTGTIAGLLEPIKWWVNSREQWGVPIGKHQSISRKIANMASDLFAMDALVYLACSFADRANADIRLEAAAAKYFCTETTHRVLDDLIQVRGGRGYETDTSLYHRGERPMPVNRFFRDGRVGRIFEGSSEVMHLIMAREAMDTHFKLVMPLMQPKPGQKESKASLIWNAFKFYSTWYPGLYMPASTDFKVKHLDGNLQDHLAFAARTCKRLAKSLFHTMAKFGPKLEYEQLILANFVEIGVDLFVMGCTLAKAEQLLAKNPKDRTPAELADLFCRNARERIEMNFYKVKHNHNKLFNKSAKSLMSGEYDWMVTDVFNDLPPQYRDWESKTPKAQAGEDYGLEETASTPQA